MHAQIFRPGEFAQTLTMLLITFVWMLIIKNYGPYLEDSDDQASRPLAVSLRALSLTAVWD